MEVTLFNPIDKNEKKTTIIDLSVLDIYLCFQRALDWNPSTPEFQTYIQNLKPHIRDADVADWWFEKLSKIVSPDDNPTGMNYILEDWIEDWYISDFIDARYPILHFNGSSVEQNNNTQQNCAVSCQT